MDKNTLLPKLKKLADELNIIPASTISAKAIDQKIKILSEGNTVLHKPALLAILTELNKLKSVEDAAVQDAISSIYFDVEIALYTEIESQFIRLLEQAKTAEKKVNNAQINVMSLNKQSEELIRELRDNSLKKINEDASIFRTEFDQLIKQKNDLVESSDGVEKQLKDRHDTIKRLLNDVSSEEISSNYFKESVNELKSSRVNKILAIVWMFFISVSISNVIDKAINGGLNLSSSSALYLTGLFALLALPALFLSKEATKRRREHNDLRRTALNMQVLGAYIYDLKDEDRAEVKKRIAELIYSNNQPQADADTGFLIAEFVKNFRGK